MRYSTKLQEKKRERERHPFVSKDVERFQIHEEEFDTWEKQVSKGPDRVLLRQGDSQRDPLRML